MRAPVIATGSNSKGDLRAWLAQLVGEGRLAVATENLSLRHELAAVAKRLEREQAVLFPKPDGHAVPVVANLLADRSWVADAIGVPERGMLTIWLGHLKDARLSAASARIPAPLLFPGLSPAVFSESGP